MNDNKLIAEFMGLISVDNNDNRAWFQVEEEFYLNNEFRYKNEIQYTTSDMLPYKESWDWLIPVLHKIGKIFNEEDTVCRQWAISFADYNLTDLSIGDSYETILEFIKWYNKNK